MLRYLHPSLELLVDIRSLRTTLFLRENFPCLAHKHDNICIREDPVVFSHGLLECLHLQPSPVDEQKSESYVTTTILSVESLRLTLSVSVIVFFVSTITAGLQEGPIEGDEGIPVELWRYANFSPLLDEGDDALSCVITTALRSTHWHRFGQKIQLVPNPPQCDQIDGLMVIPKWILLPLSGLDEHECDGEVGPPLIKVKRLRVIVNIASDTVPYANMKKTSLERKKPLLSSLISGISEAMAVVHRELNENYHNPLFASREHISYCCAVLCCAAVREVG